VEVADGVHAYEQPYGGWCVSNAGVVTGADGVVVVDTVATVARARGLRDAVAGLTSAPVRTVVNTHHHGDHTFGNDAFGPGVTIVAHEQARAEMAATGLALTGLWPQVDWGDIQLTLPSLTFSDRLALHVGSRRLDVLHVGPAHTAGDAVVWLPEERVLFAGDVVLSGCTPFVLMGSVRGSLDALQVLRALEPVTIVGGHGPVGGAGLIATAERYLRWVQDLAAGAHAAGLTPLEAARSADLGEFADLLDAERLVGNLYRAYAELTGESPDLIAAFDDMVAYHGGLPACLA
jgi:cyclase